MPLRHRTSQRRAGRETAEAGRALRRLVDRVSHSSGLALSVMDDAGVTLPQVLLLARVERRGAPSLSQLAETFQTSLPAVSQMVDRLVHQGWIVRAEDRVDRRRKSLAMTAKASALLRRLEAARATEYQRGLAGLSPKRRAQLSELLTRVVAELEDVVDR